MATIIRENKAGLSVLVRQTDAAPADSLILLLHGWGADAADLMDLSPALASRFPGAVVAAPDGPAPCAANPMGREWFDLTGATLDNGPDEAMPQLKELISILLEDHGLGYDRLALIGFSQGGMMALHTGLRMAEPVAGVVSFSGALLAPEKLEDEKTASPRVLLVHGKDDEVVPWQAMMIAESMLKSVDVDVTASTREGLGHGIDGKGFEEAMAFLSVTLLS